MSDVAAIILAAGRSQRMGAFKPLLPFGDKTVVDHCVDNVRNAGIETIVVVVGQDTRAEDLKTHLKDSGVTFAVNSNPSSEMSASISRGVRAMPGLTKAVIILPVDHPAVTPDVVVALIDEWTAGSRLVVPTWQNRGGHPVLIDLSFREELLGLENEAGERGLRSLFDSHPDLVKRLPVNSNYIARDMDKWDDYVALHREVFGGSPDQRKA